MTREEAKRVAAEAFRRLERLGVQPFDDTGWMNPEDRDAITGPFADAILAAAGGEVPPGLGGVCARCGRPAGGVGQLLFCGERCVLEYALALPLSSSACSVPLTCGTVVDARAK